jgi:hypothetical protein
MAVYVMLFGAIAALAFITSPRRTNIFYRLVLVVPLFVYLFSLRAEYEKISPISEKFKDLYESLEYAIFVPYAAIAAFTSLYIILVLALPAFRVTQAFGWVTAVVAILSYLASAVFRAQRKQIDEQGDYQHQPIKNVRAPRRRDEGQRRDRAEQHDVDRHTLRGITGLGDAFRRELHAGQPGLQGVPIIPQRMADGYVNRRKRYHHERGALDFSETIIIHRLLARLSTINRPAGLLSGYSILRLFFGHPSRQSPHLVHLSSSTSHFFSLRVTVIAPCGHFFAQIPQNTQVSSHFKLPSFAAAPSSSGFSNVSTIL